MIAGESPSSRATTAVAPGKVILCGEHAVVYGRPAIAVPVHQVQARVAVVEQSPGVGCIIRALDLGRTIVLAEASDAEPLALIVRLTLAELNLPADPDWRIDVTSDIPIASGLGSGAAVSTAAVRAIFKHAGRTPDPETVSRLVFRSEELHHGTPSGIDNTVIAHEQPVWFVRGQPPQIFTPAHPFTLAIADSGIPSPTRETVADVRRAWQANPQKYEALFDRVAEIVTAARTAMERGAVEELGPLFDGNQALLREIGVSSEPLERLIRAARDAGAAGAKLSGGGRGGNIIALVVDETAGPVEEALYQAGAKRVIVTTVGGAGD
jgi:mevalonate kinase